MHIYDHSGSFLSTSVLPKSAVASVSLTSRSNLLASWSCCKYLDNIFLKLDGKKQTLDSQSLDLIVSEKLGLMTRLRHIESPQYLLNPIPRVCSINEIEKDIWNQVLSVKLSKEAEKNLLPKLNPLILVELSVSFWCPDVWEILVSSTPKLKSLTVPQPEPMHLETFFNCLRENAPVLHRVHLLGNGSLCSDATMKGIEDLCRSRPMKRFVLPQTFVDTKARDILGHAASEHQLNARAQSTLEKWPNAWRVVRPSLYERILGCWDGEANSGLAQLLPKIIDACYDNTGACATEEIIGAFRLEGPHRPSIENYVLDTLQSLEERIDQNTGGEYLILIYRALVRFIDLLHQEHVLRKKAKRFCADITKRLAWRKDLLKQTVLAATVRARPSFEEYLVTGRRRIRVVRDSVITPNTTLLCEFLSDPGWLKHSGIDINERLPLSRCMYAIKIEAFPASVYSGTCLTHPAELLLNDSSRLARVLAYPDFDPRTIREAEGVRPRCYFISYALLNLHNNRGNTAGKCFKILLGMHLSLSNLDRSLLLPMEPSTTLDKFLAKNAEFSSIFTRVYGRHATVCLVPESQAIQID